jgi:hypothetical protein
MDQTGITSAPPAEIEQDWEVYAADGQKIGNVNEVHANYIWVQEGLLFPKDMYIPTTVIERTEPGRVLLTVTMDQVSTAGWDTLPAAIPANAPVPGTVQVTTVTTG